MTKIHNKHVIDTQKHVPSINQEEEQEVICKKKKSKCDFPPSPLFQPWEIRNYVDIAIICKDGNEVPKNSYPYTLKLKAGLTLLLNITANLKLSCKKL